MRTFVHHTLSSATLLMVALSVMGQTAPNTWWVQFTDKDNTPYSIDQPEAFLTLRAIQRRQQQGIAIDELDLPVDPVYINTVLALGEVQLVNRSKWFNAITIRTSDPLCSRPYSSFPSSRISAPRSVFRLHHPCRTSSMHP
jgi:serine protease AprX